MSEEEEQSPVERARVAAAILDDLVAVFPRSLFEGCETPRDRWLHVFNLVRESQRDIARVETRCANLELRIESMKAVADGALTIDHLAEIVALKGEVRELKNALAREGGDPE